MTVVTQKETNANVTVAEGFPVEFFIQYQGDLETSATFDVGDTTGALETFDTLGMIVLRDYKN
jgi:hypothetical protein